MPALLRSIAPLLVASALTVGCAREEAPPPAEGPRQDVAAPAGAEAAKPGVPDEFPRFTPQEGWVTEAVTNAMRLHQFRLPGEPGVGDVEVVVASWPTGIGAREENLSRWASQVGAPGIDPSRRWERDVRRFRVTTVELEGAYKPDQGEARGAGTALLASWIEVAGDTHVWTVKATGPTASVAQWRASYDAFLAGL